MKFSEVIARAISLATAIRAYWDVELPRRHPQYPVIAPGEDSGPPPPEQAALRALLDSLPDEFVYKLALVMLLGRGDFGTGSLAEHYAALKKTFSPRDRAIAQIMGKSLLADYWSDGLAALAGSGIDADRLDFTSITSAA